MIMKNFQDSMINRIKTILREVHWYEAGLENMPFKLVRADINHQYSFKCKTLKEDHWDLYTLTHYVGPYYDWVHNEKRRGGWYLHKCGIPGNKVFLKSDFYDLTPEILFQKVQEFLIMLVMEDG